MTNLRKAVRQLEGAKLLGVAVCSVEPILHPPAPRGGLSAQKPAPTSRFAASAEERDAFADQTLKTAIQVQLPEINRLFGGHECLAGVLFCGAFVALLEDPSAYTYRWLSRSVARPDDPQAATLTNLLRQLLAGSTALEAGGSRAP